MSWIKDVAEDIRLLDSSAAGLKKFGLSVGTVLLVLSGILFWREVVLWLVVALGGIALLMILSGLLFPKLLKPLYLVWMGFAFAMGWLVSRIILIFLYYVVVFPIGLLTRLAGKEFLDKKFKNKRDTYWLSKADNVADYKKMH